MRAVRHAPAKQHNPVLSRAVCVLGQVIGAGLLAENTARAELTTAGRFLIGRRLLRWLPAGSDE